MCLADKETQLIKMSEEVQKLLAQERTHIEHISELEELFLSKDKQFDMLQKEVITFCLQSKPRVCVEP